jgi:hypothetical protein
MVAARWGSLAAYAGGIPGASAPAGTPVASSSIDIMRVENGRFAEYWVSSDGLAVMAQLGAFASWNGSAPGCAATQSPLYAARRCGKRVLAGQAPRPLGLRG